MKRHDGTPLPPAPRLIEASTTEWIASFVSAGTPSEPGDPAVYFRREFTTHGGLRRAVLHITGLGIVEPYLNGTRIGGEVLAPGWTPYQHRLMVSSHDITDLIIDGANALGAIVGDGWAVGRISYEGKRHHYSDRPALFAQLELEYDDETTVIDSGEGFRTGTGAVRANGIYEGEDFDARQEPHGWSRPGFDDTAWQNAVSFDWDVHTLHRPTAPPIRRIEELTPAEILTSPSGRTIVDFGQNISGWVRIDVTGEAGRTITIRHAEALTPEGEPEFETNRTAQATDRYTLRGGGNEVWEPRFTFHGFRYAVIEGWPGDPAPSDLKAVVVHSDMARTGWFETSNALVNRLHSNVVWSMRDNFVGVPTDCPQRDERLGWTGDLNAFAPTAAFLYDVRGVLGSWLDDLAAEQKEKGYVPWIVPDVLSHPSAPTAIWSDVAVSLPWTLYQEYGDLEILRRSYTSMTAFVRQVEALLDENGVWSSGFQFGDWLDPDAPAESASDGKTDKHLVATAFFCKTTTEMATTAALLGEDADATHFAALAARVRAGFHREYVAPSGRLVSESATAYALAISFGILEDDQRATAGRRLAELVAKAGYTVSTGFAGTPHVAGALSDTGHLDEAYLLLLQEECPSFLYPLSMGATTIWERWDSIRPDGTLNSTGMTSLNHYALGSVADWLHRVVGGIRRAGAGYSSALIAPQPGGGLTSATVVHDTVRGRIAVSWAIADDRLQLDVDVPAGMKATVVLPMHPEGRTIELDGGAHSWNYQVTDGRDGRPAFTLDSPLSEIVQDAGAWYAVQKVFNKHLPGIPIDGSAPEAAVMTLNMVLGMMPGTVPEFEVDLREALVSS